MVKVLKLGIKTKEGKVDLFFKALQALLNKGLKYRI